MPRILTGFGIVLVASGIAAYALRGRPASPVPKSEARETGSTTAVGPTEPASPVAARPARRATAPVLSEASLMATLRELGETDPERSIALARAGNGLYPTSPDAPERAWIVAKSLVALNRFHEARDEARAMVEKYPGSPWAVDAERHLLVYPLDQPSREEQQAQEQPPP